MAAAFGWGTLAASSLVIADQASGHRAVIAGIFAGCAVFFGGDWLIDRSGGGDRKDATGAQEDGSALAMCSGLCSTASPSRW